MLDKDKLLQNQEAMFVRQSKSFKAAMTSKELAIYHRKRNRVQKERRNRLRAMGACLRCGRSDVIGGRSACEDCSEKARIQTQTKLEKRRISHATLSFKGTCDLCGNMLSRSRSFLDHCHKRGDNRGYLCSNCNAGLGMFKDSVELLEKAIAYIKDHEARPITPS